ncbi:C2H2-type zinc finger protein [Chloroflexota bacterium]
MSYKCPVCNKVSSSAMDLSRHMMGRGDKVHRDWITSKGFKYSELLTLQIKSFGGEGYKALSEVLEKETKIKD